MTAPAAFAETEKGKDYSIEYKGTTADNRSILEYSSHPERIFAYNWNGKPIYKDYLYFEDSNIVRFETANAGSVEFDKNTCTYNLYEPGLVSGQTPKIKNIGWTVKGKIATSPNNWQQVNSVNNAACQVAVSATDSTFMITGTKTSAGAGTFQIKLSYMPGHGIKETMRAYNDNPVWNNHNIGFTETYEVPQIIHFGGSQYDLSQYNNTVLGRNWIENNEAKLVRLSDKIFYDFGIGFDNLNDIKITWINGKAKLALNYLYPTVTVPYQTWFEVDPTFNSLTTNQGRVYTAAAGSNCATATGDTADSTLEVIKSLTTCSMVWQDWSITASSIPSSSTVTGAYFEWDQTGTTIWIQDCGLYAYATRPSTLSTANKWSQGWAGQGSGTTSLCTSDGSDKRLTLNSTGLANLQSNISGGEGWWGAMFQGTSPATTAAVRSFAVTTAQTKLAVNFTVPRPDAVTDLAAIGQASNSIILVWSQPNLHGAPLLGYMINYTTPLGNPTTVLNNNTGTSTASAIISGLAESTPYSFRVSPWTMGGTNGSGNIANATSGINTGNFTIGGFDVNEINPNILGILFERINLNSTHTLVNVTYDNDYTLDCTVNYRYAQETDTYLNVSGNHLNSARDEYSFRFINPASELINIRCTDRSTNDTGTYVLTQNDFPFKQQINNFRNGTYGTAGQFGAFDLITLGGILFAMIGLNRVNETVGVIFSFILIGVLGFFEIITWPTIVAGAIAIIIMLTVATTRKD